MYNGEIPTTVNIPLGLKNIDVVFYIKPYSVTESKSITLTTPMAYLYLRLKTSSQAEAYELGGYKSISYPITELNLRYVKNLFMEGLSWFSKELRDEIWTYNGADMIFNEEYKNLSAVHIDEFNSIKTGLKLTPGIEENADGKYDRVVILAINTNGNRAILKEYEFERLSNFILEFDFVKYNMYIMDLVNYSYFSGSYKVFDKNGGANNE